jgi:hypothetical protein
MSIAPIHSPQFIAEFASSLPRTAGSILPARGASERRPRHLDGHMVPQTLAHETSAEGL